MCLGTFHSFTQKNPCVHAMCQYVIPLQILQSSKEDKKVRKQIKYSVGDKEQGEAGSEGMLLRLGHQSLSLRRCCLSKTKKTPVISLCKMQKECNSWQK